MEINERVLRATDPEVRGLVVVELTDRHTGRTLERVEVENDISQWWQFNARRYARSLFFTSNPSQTPLDRAVTVGLNHVFLSSSNESLSEPLISGSMVGWGSKDAYSGSSTKRGTLVAADCLSLPDSTRYVWEWPTTAANGIVRSVGMCETAGSDSQVGAIRLSSRSPAIDGRALYFPRTHCLYFDPVGNMLWSIESNTVTGRPVTVGPNDVVGVTDYVTSAVSASAVRGNIGFPSNNLSDVSGDGTNLYVAAGTSTIKKFAAPTTLGSDPAESTISVSGRTVMSFLAHDGSYLWVSEGAMVYRVNATSGAIERSFAIAGSPYGMQWYPERSLLAVGITVGGVNYLYGYDLNGVVQFIATHPTGETTMASNGGCTYLADHQVVFLSAYYYGGYSRECEILSSLSTGSRTVLGAEVEKTNLTGMKLTYTFTFS